MVKKIGVISIKGGVGKTTTVVNLGAILATQFGKKVLIVDANFSAPNLGLHLGIVDPEYTLHDVLSNKVKTRDAVINHDLGFDVLPGALVYDTINPYKLKQKLNDVKSNYDFIMIDSSPNLNEEILATMMAADELLVVTSPDYPTLSTTMHAIKVAKNKKTPISGLILNKTRNKRFELTLEDIEQATEVPVLAVLPDDIKLLEALALTKPANDHSPMSDAVVEYKKLGACLVGQEFEDPRFKSRIRKLFSTGSRKEELNRKLLLEERNKR